MSISMKIAGIAALGVMSFASMAQAADVLTYDILKDGKKIGQEVVTITENGGETKVDVATQTEVELLFFKFSYDHKRTETWQGDTLVAVQAQTNDDGEPHSFTLKKSGDGFSGTVDGQAKVIEGKAFPLALWTEKVTDYTALFGVIDAAPYAVKTVQNADGSYTMSGDAKRQLWYGADGRLDKTAFKRKGYDIEFVRQK